VSVACTSQPLLSSDEPSAPSVDLPYTLEVFDHVDVSSNPDAEHFQHVTGALDFGAGPVAAATLTVELDSPCFPFDGWSADTVPAGQNFPTFCDAFDRTLSVSLDAPEDPSAGPPGLELARAITPFGGPFRFDTDVTDIVNGLPGAHTLRVDIGTWGDASGQVTGTEGKWIVSARVLIQPGTAPRSVLAVEALTFENVTETDPPPFLFAVPDGATRGQIEYRATGHGGATRGTNCSGPAEEFCKRTHTLSVDGAPVDEFQPWRADCASLCTLASYRSTFLDVPSYCAENPCGLPASVRASRANWCPGSVTPPRRLESAELSVPGEHRLALHIDEVATGGLWTVSATYVAYE
jgi:hypothetical protein